MRLWDTKCGYGWVSIALHWATAIAVAALWYTGTVSQVADSDGREPAVRLHTTIALTAYAVLWGRILWRFYAGHPGRLPRQRSYFFALGKAAHYSLLLAIAVMLITGPLTAMAGNGAIGFFGLTIASPVGMLPELYYPLRRAHGMTATFLVGGTALHILAVLLHSAILRDGTFDKIMIAARGSQE